MINKRTKKIELNGQNLILKANRKQETIHISKVNKINIYVHPISKVYAIFAIVLVLNIFLFLNLNYLSFALIALVAITLIIIAKEKSYEIKIFLKGRTPIAIPFSKESKKEYIDMVQEIKKEIFNFKMESDK